ncbi:hypothetical protein ASF73_07645 [Xanthomonas sp. Leaf131]|nr:hypothetical protein ASF73_07645 [Xanthomonas sp. Leaf131]
MVWSRWQALPGSAETQGLERLLAAVAIYLIRTCAPSPLQIRLRYGTHTRQLDVHPAAHDTYAAICQQVRVAMDRGALDAAEDDGAHSIGAPRGDAAHAWPALIEIDAVNESVVIVSAATASQLHLQICQLRKRFRCGIRMSQSTQRQALRVGARLRCLLAALERPEAQHSPAASLPLLPGSERSRVLHTFNCSDTQFPQRGMAALFAEQVANAPQAIALVDGNIQLSYAELDLQSSRLAHFLCALGVGPDCLVAISAARGPALVIGLLAILKAGGGYLPLDADTPQQRLRALLDDARPLAVLADTQSLRRLSLPDALPVCLLDQAHPAWATLPDTAPDVPALQPHHLAYVLYTSGSTGVPKGVMVEQRNVVRLVCTPDYADCDASQCFLLAAPLAFDASTFELWGALLNGARLVLAPPGALDLDVICAQVQHHQVTTLWLTAGLFELLGPAQLAQLHSVRQLFAGGDVLSRTAIERVNRTLPHCQLINAYGPTEATTFSTCHRFDKAPVTSVPIGRPIASTRIYLLDDQRELVPIGVPGEIYIGGPGVARGYLNQPGLTEERFSDDPFVPGGRLYRSGDLARWREDGSLDFLGRCDHQLKVRGFRIEPGEIEAALRRCAGVDDAVVVARQEGAADKQLVAYVVAGKQLHSNTERSDSGHSRDDIDDALAPATLRAALARYLPKHMLPSVFVPLQRLPLTASGKVDRRALPAPDRDAVAAAGYAPPQGAYECFLAGLWAELLGLPQVGRHDHFFALGGHSLLAMRVSARLQAAFARQVPMTLLFAHPVLCDFALALQDSAGDALSAIPRLPRNQPLPLSFAQQRLWFLDQLEGPNATYIMPMGLRLHGALDRDALRAALHALVARHEALRSCFRQRRLQQTGDVVSAAASTSTASVSSAAIPYSAEQLDAARVHVELLPPEQALVLHEHQLIDHALIDHCELDAELQHWIAYEASTPFQLDRDAPARFRLLQLSAEQHVLLITQHHSASDGWSVGVLLHELSALYVSCLRGQPNPLPPLPIQYPDYAAWQRQWLDGSRGQQQLDYWKRQLDGAPSLLDLPLDRPRPPQQDFSGAEVPIRFDADLSDGLEIMARRHGCTVFMAVLAAWGALLSRLCRQECVLVGIPVAGRTRAELGPLIGLFVNTLAIRFDAPASLDTATLLAQVRQRVLDAQAHQDVPFEQVVQAVQPVRSSAHTALVQTMLAWEQDSIAPATPSISGTSMEHAETTDDPWAALHPQLLQIPATSARFDLILQLRSGGQPAGQPSSEGTNVHGTLSYATALFDAASATRIVGYLHSVLRAMVADSAAPLDTITLLGPSERRQLLVDFQPASIAYPSTLLHTLIEQQMQRTPHAIAVAQDHLQLDYAALDAQANRLAHHLRQLGVGPDVRVAICAQRSPGLVVGLLAILKAGGAYVPLDPDYPAQRLADMLADSQPLALLIDAYAREHIPLFASDALDRVSLLDTETSNSVLLCKGLPKTLAVYQLDQTHSPWAHQPGTAPDVTGLQPHHLAYVIYTSGSTGTPKGAMNTHRGVVNRLLWMQDTYALTADDVVLQKTPISFDVSVWELFWPCARLQLARPGGHKDPAYLGATIAQAGVTTLHFVPSMLDAFLATDAAQQCGGLTRVICSGEALPGQLVQRFRAQLPNVQLHNLYGPTEAAIDVSFWDCTATTDVPDNTPIGTPVANTQLYVLDAHLQPTPIGVAGELHIGGVQVARGYLGRPELSAQRFIPDPFRSAPSAQLYKTGDLARWRSDGVLEYLGRNDDQVKIRGLRIEPGEIAARLANHSDVRDAVVLARTDETGQLRLVAYYLAATALPVEALRSHLAAQLPDYMVPAAYVHLEALPLTPNGKLDRRALPAPTEDALATRHFVPPQGPIECAIAAHWCELLGVQQVGRDDQFFALGGHSLLAIHLVERLRANGLHAEVRNLFASPTLAGFAASLRSNADTNNALIVPPNRITPGLTQLTPQHLPLADLTQQDIDRVLEQVPGGIANVQDIYALSPFQHGLLFHHLLATDGDPYVLRLRLRFADRTRLDAYLTALQTVIDRHDILRSAVLWEGLSEPVQAVYRHATLPIDVLHCSGFDPQQPFEHQLATLPHSRQLDLRRAPLLHASVVADSDGQRWHLLVLQHHLIGDHTTLDTIQSEIQTLQTGRGAELAPPQPFRNLVAQARLGLPQTAHEAFFRERLGDLDTPCAPLGLLQATDAAPSEHTMVLDASLVARLREAAQRLGVSLASLCHLAWGLVVARTSGCTDAVFGSVLFGRMGQTGAGALGPFINTLPLRVALAEPIGAEAAVRRTHADLAALLHHEHASLALAQRCSAVPAPAPLFTALFNYRHNRHSGDASLLGGEERTHYPIHLAMEDDGHGLALTAQVCAVLEPRRLCSYLATALSGLVDALEHAPQTPVQRLPVLPKAEQTQVLEEFNATVTALAPGICLHQLFEAQVQRSPDAIAVELDARSLSYAELDAQANQLAHHLRSLGVGPECRVALCLQRSVEMVIGLLGILKAGAAYVPLDPEYPSERLAYMLADSQPLAVLCDDYGLARIPQRAELTYCRLDAPELPWHAQPTSAPQLPDLHPDCLAYVIYTSGSTGQPKGVMNAHRGVVNRLQWHQTMFPLGPHDRALQKTPFGFDISLWEIFSPLQAGARLVLARPQGHQDPQYLATVIEQRGITQAHFVPSMLQLFLDQAEPPRCPSLRWLLCSGEALSDALQRRCLQALPHVELHNLYGPTEAAIEVSHWQCDPQLHPGLVPIGRPIANTRLYVLDTHGQPVPVGVPGELHIGGVQVARGYWNLPELSAERFVADDHFDVHDARRYKTGDLARWLPDGNLQYLGRNDHQVKIRGLRVELSEIESRLLAAPGVREAVVLAREDSPGLTRLVAYLTALPDADAAALRPATLRAALECALPEHMLPSAWVVLPKLPLTANGKLDRKALPAPEGQAFALRPYSAPTGPTECLVAAHWCRLLGLPQVGRDDDFFALGGQSLLAVRLLAQLSEQAQVRLPLSAVFEFPTLAAFSRRLALAQLQRLAPDALAQLSALTEMDHVAR